MATIPSTGNVQIETLLTIAEEGDFTTRVLAVTTLENLISLGVIQNSQITSAVTMLRNSIYASQTSMKSRGVYVAKVVGSQDPQFLNLVLVGTTENWPETLEMLKDIYGSIWLMIFIGAENIDFDSMNTWEVWIRSALRNNKAKIEGTYYLSDRRAKELADAIQSIVIAQNLIVNVSISYMLKENAERYEREFGKKAGEIRAVINQPIYQPEQISEPKQPQFIYPSENTGGVKVPVKIVNQPQPTPVNPVVFSANSKKLGGVTIVENQPKNDRKGWFDALTKKGDT